LDLLEAIILGIVQGATEFLPVSSSGHLVLVSWWLGLDSPPLIYTVIVHLGTTVAILLFFWKDWWQLLQAGFRAVKTRNFYWNQNLETRLLTLLIVGTIPAAVIGFLLADFFEDLFSTPALVSLNLFVTAGLLIYGEWATRRSEALLEDSRQTGVFDSFIIGSAQALAIMPGISRSGSTIAAGMTRGLDRSSATRFSFLLATPIILAAGVMQAAEVITNQESIETGLRNSLIAGFISSTVVGFLCILLLLRLVRRHGFYGFAGYCILFGLVSLGGVLVRG
jgi:undecaprenyl-diphosphatase